MNCPFYTGRGQYPAGSWGPGWVCPGDRGRGWGSLLLHGARRKRQGQQIFGNIYNKVLPSYIYGVPTVILFLNLSSFLKKTQIHCNIFQYKLRFVFLPPLDFLNYTHMFLFELPHQTLIIPPLFNILFYECHQIFLLLSPKCFINRPNFKIYSPL